MDSYKLRQSENSISYLFNNVFDLKNFSTNRGVNIKTAEAQIISKQIENIDQKVKKLESHLFINDRKDLLDIINSNILDPNKKFFGAKDLSDSSEFLMQKNNSLTAFPQILNELDYRPSKKIHDENNKKTMCIKKKLFEKKKDLNINQIMKANFLKSPQNLRHESQMHIGIKDNSDIKINHLKSIPDFSRFKREQEQKRRIEEFMSMMKNKEKYKEEIFSHVYKNLNDKSYIKIVDNYEKKEVKNENTEMVKKEKEKLVIYCPEKKVSKKLKLEKENHIKKDHGIDIKDDNYIQIINKEKEETKVEPQIQPKKQKKIFKMNIEPKKRIISIKPYFNVVLAIVKMRIFANSDLKMIDKVRKFIRFYDNQQEEKLNSFIFISTKTAYLSIANFNDLKLDLSEGGSFFKCSEPERKDKLIKLSTRLSTFFDNLIENTTEEKMESELIEYLNYITSNSSYVPKEFYTSFELKRLQFSSKGCLKKITIAQKKMILCIYILCRILVKNILIDHKFSTMNIMNVNIRKNFKIVASIIYRCVIDYCTELIDKLNTLSCKSNDSVFDKHSLQTSKERTKVLEEVMNLLPKIIRPSNDNSEDEIAYINSSLYKKNELTNYFNMAKDYNFNLTSKIEKWDNTLIKILEKHKK